MTLTTTVAGCSSLSPSSELLLLEEDFLFSDSCTDGAAVPMTASVEEFDLVSTGMTTGMMTGTADSDAEDDDDEDPEPCRFLLVSPDCTTCSVTTVELLTTVVVLVSSTT